MENKEKKIAEFWSWFQTISESLALNFEQENIINELDNWIYKLGSYSWEIREGLQKKNALVISPEGNKDLLIETKYIISKAPQNALWEFNYAKPPKDWVLIFDIEDNGNEILVDANTWEYALLKYENEIDIVIKPNDILIHNDDLKYTACVIVLDGILGEELRMDVITNIEIVSEFDEELEQQKTKMDFLYKHLLKFKL